MDSGVLGFGADQRFKGARCQVTGDLRRHVVVPDVAVPLFVSYMSPKGLHPLANVGGGDRLTFDYPASSTRHRPRFRQAKVFDPWARRGIKRVRNRPMNPARVDIIYIVISH